MIKKTQKGWATIHCHGLSKGKIIHEFTGKGAHAEALAQHKAIATNKALKRGKM